MYNDTALEDGMKERIQALIYQLNNEVGVHWTNEGKIKFAQLIVRECAELAKHHVMNISTYADAEFVDEQIKQNFGVK